jgi:LDH2 family malate/lactate/ureidoglycolate dehydrogenase
MAHDTATPPLYTVESLQDFSTLLLRRAGLTDDKAMSVAATLVEGDLMGHSTHGLQLLSPYLGALERGDMTKEGGPEIVADHGGAVTWDGRYLPGPWLVHSAIDLALERIATHKVVTIVIRRSSHIGCLAAYPKRATDRGLLLSLTCSDPSVTSVAPFGSVEPAYTPNPLAFGWPTDGDPVIVDISASTTTNGMTIRLHDQKKKLDGPWLVDAQGSASNDPAVLFNEPKGAILPLGGVDLGHKGFGLGLWVEALTAGLGGHGRADKPTRWGASVFLQLMDPAAFGGRDAFVRETSAFAARCRAAAVPPGKPPVRLPGERALKRVAEQRRVGVALHPDIMPALRPWSEKFGVPLPVTTG